MCEWQKFAYEKHLNEGSFDWLIGLEYVSNWPILSTRAKLILREIFFFLRQSIQNAPCDEQETVKGTPILMLTSLHDCSTNKLP